MLAKYLKCLCIVDSLVNEILTCIVNKFSLHILESSPPEMEIQPLCFQPHADGKSGVNRLT